MVTVLLFTMFVYLQYILYAVLTILPHSKKKQEIAKRGLSVNV